MYHTPDGEFSGIMSAVINCFTDGFATICYILPSNEKIINFKSDDFCTEWDVFKSNNLTYSQCISLISEKFVCEDEREKFISELSRKNIIMKLKETSCLLYNYHIDKEQETIHYSVKIVSAPDGGIIIGFKNVEKEHEMLKSLRNAIDNSHTDNLTELFNRPGTIAKINEKMKRSNSLSAVFFIDIDNFKRINDVYGHTAGDDALYFASRIISAHTPFGAVAGRIGGDEFIVFIDNITKKEYAYKQAEKICAAFRNAINPDDSGILLTASIGISFSDESSDVAKLIDIADKRMYTAKKNGKNRVV